MFARSICVYFFVLTAELALVRLRGDICQGANRIHVGEESSKQVLGLIGIIITGRTHLSTSSFGVWVGSVLYLCVQKQIKNLQLNKSGMLFKGIFWIQYVLRSYMHNVHYHNN